MGEWKLTSTQIKYSNKEGICLMDLPTRLSRSYKNYIHQGEYFVLLACGNQLFSFSCHQNPKSNFNNVIAATTEYGDNNIVYIITNSNQLYKCEYKNGNPSLFNIGRTNINKGENIVKMCASKENLWLITDNHLYKISKKGKTTLVAGKTNEKIDFRSILYSDGKLFIGSRYYLYRIDDPDNIKNITLDNRIKVQGFEENNLYITDIRKNKSEDKMYFSSLNKGLFCLDSVNDTLLEQIPNSDTIGNIRKIINHRYLFTSKGIYHLRDSGTISKVCSKEPLLYSVYNTTGGDGNILYTVGYSGIGHYRENDLNTVSVKKSLFQFDVSFNPAAIAPIKENLLLGSQSGLFIYHFDGKLEIVDIPDEPANWSLIIATVLIAISFMLIAYILMLYKNTEKRLINIANTIQQCEEKKSTVKKEKETELGLSGKLTEIESRYNEIGRKIIVKILKLRNNRRIIRGIETELKDLRTNIDINQIKRENIINQYNTLIGILNQKIEQYEAFFIDAPDKNEKWNSCKSKQGDSIDSCHILLNNLVALILSLTGTLKEKWENVTQKFNKLKAENENITDRLVESDRTNKEQLTELKDLRTSIDINQIERENVITQYNTLIGILKREIKKYVSFFIDDKQREEWNNYKSKQGDSIDSCHTLLNNLVTLILSLTGTIKEKE
jgi:hypothetical protein